MSATEARPFTPREPESLEETGLAESFVEQILLKILYFRGDVYGKDLSNTIGLKFSVIQGMVESLKLRHLVQVKRSLGMSDVGQLLELTESGRARARECLEKNQYAGAAPVPLEQYVEVVRQQRPRDGWLTKDALAKAFRGLVITDRVLSQVGPAVSSAHSLLVYGKPGDGKTLLIESLRHLESTPVFVPHAIECNGNIVQVFDPVYHERIEEEPDSLVAIAAEGSWDRRWVQCRRPFIVSGGELTLDMLDLRHNRTSGVHEAPFQLKANNGIYLIDDFGRQRVTPADVLNRWVAPMERRLDYLSFETGGKMTTPFETFLVFSTNLKPAELGDEAFMRRIQYKMLLRGPAEHEFIRIFESFCIARRIPCTRELINRFIERHYRKPGKPFRRCQPRDVLSHALNLIHFEKLPLQLTDEILDRAFESCFFQEEGGETPADARILPVVVQSCTDYWGDHVAQIPTAFGTLSFVAALRDRVNGRYYDPDSARDYGDAETHRVLARLHEQSFAEWLSLKVDQQGRDLNRYLASTGTSVERLRSDPEELIAMLAPPAAKAEERDLFGNNLATVLEALTPAQPRALELPVKAPKQDTPAAERIA
jgi:DNA-binding MarR family transcriptional regulator